MKDAERSVNTLVEDGSGGLNREALSANEFTLAFVEAQLQTCLDLREEVTEVSNSGALHVTILQVTNEAVKRLSIVLRFRW